MAGARFFARLPFYLRRQISLTEANTRLAEGLRRRSGRFLDRLRNDVFAHAGSVYSELFRHAGCTTGDLESAVAAGASAAGRIGELTARHVIPAPEPQLEDVMLETGHDWAVPGTESAR